MKKGIMEREIKFRYFWQHKEVGTIYSHEHTLQEIEVAISCCQPGYDIIARAQFTGLKDGNGKDIYDGDVLNCSTTRFTPSSYTGSNPLRRLFYGTVEYGTAGFLVRLSNQRQIDKLGGKSVIHFSIMDEYEVIGNIYENPEFTPA